MAHFADKLHVDKEKIDRVELAVLLSLIGGGLALCVLGAAVYDIGRAFSSGRHRRAGVFAFTFIWKA